MSHRLIYMTVGSEAEAKTIGRTLVEERLVACVNVLGGISSFYWWEGEVQEDGEVALIAKTTSADVEAVIARVKALHSYDCPCVVALPIESGNPAFLTWIDEQTK